MIHLKEGRVGHWFFFSEEKNLSLLFLVAGDGDVIFVVCR